MSGTKIAKEVLDKVWYNARTYRQFKPVPVAESVLRSIVELTTQGPTSMNTQPLRISFVQSEAAKAKLLKCVMAGNVPAVQAAPVTAILAYDNKFKELLPKLSPNYDAKAVFDANPDWIAPTAVLNGHLQAGYFIIAARSLGLDTGAMSGLDPKAIDKEFFDGTDINSFMIVNLGYGVEGTPYPKAPRPDFEDVSAIL